MVAGTEQVPCWGAVPAVEIPSLASLQVYEINSRETCQLSRGGGARTERWQSRSGLIRGQGRGSSLPFPSVTGDCPPLCGEAAVWGNLH